jgi:hypothetical protein
VTDVGLRPLVVFCGVIRHGGAAVGRRGAGRPGKGEALTVRRPAEPQEGIWPNNFREALLAPPRGRTRTQARELPADNLRL